MKVTLSKKFMSGILQSQGSTLVLIDYSIDEAANVITAKMNYFESNLTSPTEVTDTVTGEKYSLIIPKEILAIGTYGVDLLREFELY